MNIAGYELLALWFVTRWKIGPSTVMLPASVLNGMCIALYLYPYPIMSHISSLVKLLACS